MSSCIKALHKGLLILIVLLAVIAYLSNSIFEMKRYKIFSLNITSSLLNTLFHKINETYCPELSPYLQGKVVVIKSPVPNMTNLERRLSWVKWGGHWEPETCKVQKKVALLVPFRNRGEHLRLFLQHMHPFLKRQQVDYTIFVIEQEDNGPFNRGMLMNVGYMEALKIKDFDCFIINDVDLLPENDRNVYKCLNQPRHMSVAVHMGRKGYVLSYTSCMGGVCAISREHFKLLNGFSNRFWGWGGEDDDMFHRVKYHKMNVLRYPEKIGRYTMLKHQHNIPNPNRFKILNKRTKYFKTDGLSNLKYTVKLKEENSLYTWFLVQLI